MAQIINELNKNKHNNQTKPKPKKREYPDHSTVKTSDRPGSSQRGGGISGGKFWVLLWKGSSAIKIIIIVIIIPP